METEGLDFYKIQNAFEDVFHEGLDKVAVRLEELWREKAKSTLNTSKDAYLAGISVERVGDEIDFSLNGALAVAVESGSDGFDMKPGILKNKPFVNVPINDGSGNPIFRRMSKRSTGWNHPGIRARNLTEQVEKEATPIIDDVFIGLISRMDI